MNVITVNAYPVIRGYEGHFVLPLTYDTNITNELSDRMKRVGARSKYDEFVFIDLSNTRYKARDLRLTNKHTDNHFSYEKDGTFATGATIFHFRCNEFSQIAEKLRCSLSTHKYITLPNDLAALVEGRSTIARYGLSASLCSYHRSAY